MSNKKIFVISMPRTASTYLFKAYTDYNSPEQYVLPCKIRKEPFNSIQSKKSHAEQIDNIYNAKRCVVVSHANHFETLTELQKKVLFTDCATHFTLLFRRNLVDMAMSLVRGRTSDFWHTFKTDKQIEIKPSTVTYETINEVIHIVHTTIHLVTYKFGALYNVSYDNIIFKEDLTYDPKTDWFNSGYCDEALNKLHIRHNILVENPPVEPFISNYDDVYTQISDSLRGFENKNIEIKDGIVKHLFGKT